MVTLVCSVAKRCANMYVFVSFLYRSPCCVFAAMCSEQHDPIKPYGCNLLQTICQSYRMWTLS